MNKYKVILISYFVEVLLCKMKDRNKIIYVHIITQTFKLYMLKKLTFEKSATFTRKKVMFP